MLRAPATRKIIFLFLLALTVRFLGIMTRPIWYDEAFSILFSQKGPSAMLYGTLTLVATSAADIHPIGYYTLLWLWMQAFGSSLTAARILSILAGAATVALVFFLTRNLFNEKLATLASLFVALAPFQIHYSQEIRMYAFLALWLTLATYSYQRGVRRDGVRWWILFSISAALAQYTHNLAAFYLIPLAFWPLLHRDWKTFGTVTLAGTGALTLYLPWLIHLPSQFSKVTNSYWVQRPGIERPFTLLLAYVTNLPLPNRWLFPALFIVLTVIIIGLIQTFKRSNRDPAAMWLLYLSFTPPILLFMVSQWIPVYIERALLPSGVIFCIWLAWALCEASLPKIVRNILVGMLILSTAAGLYQHLTYRGFPYGPYENIDASLRQRIAPGDVIIHSNKLSLLPAIYYDASLPQVFIADRPGSETDTLAESTRQVLGVTAVSDVESATRDARRVWFIIYKKSIEEAQATGAANHPHLQYLSQHFTQVAAEDWGTLQVYLFEQEP